MASLVDEAAASYNVAKVATMVAYARSEMDKLAASAPGGKAGPELAKVRQEFDGYVAAWDALKSDPAYKDDPAQLSGLAQKASDSIGGYVPRAQEAHAKDTAGAKAPKASAPSAASPAASGTPPKSEAPETAKAQAPSMGSDTWLLVAAVGLGAAALFFGKKR